ncbi:Lrp/AsnC family transcriptional regulator [Acinetobacter bereziniae]|uniref:Lrp/AsnC family transcriptional regulator n=1 Tax=Acinetobacter bereziniae TaxID=106648 RepID=UPI0029546006|nr:Lrp/AsnC family transcriptional regulator [Acinetobacter bereziniae]MDV8156611.1 Lrp/AsnC family transcriptional regulator [Acinetobacter bereziniae]
MNNIDLQILTVLKDNARTSITDIAMKLHVSRSTIQKRIEYMENNGIISGYTVKIRPNFNQNVIRAWMNIMVEGNKAQSVIKELRIDPIIESMHSTNGKWDLLVELKATNLEEFDQALGRIRRISGIYNTETSILLSTYKV